MAEVKRAASGSSFSHSTSKKKPPSFSNNGVSSSSTSFKHIYDDVFASSSPSKVKSSAYFMEDDYAEVFGSSKSNNGVWSISHNFGLPDGEELFDQLKKKPKTSSAAHILPSFRSQGQTTDATNPEISGQSYDGQSLTNGFCPSFNNTKQFEPGNKVVVNATGGPRKVTHARAYSLHEVTATQKTLSSQTPVIIYDSVDTDSKQGKHARHTSLDIGAVKQNNVSDSGLQKVSGMSGSFSVDKSRGTCQSSNTATNRFCESVDNTKLSGTKINKLSFNSTSNATHSANAHPFQESNHSIKPEARPESSLSNEISPTQKTLSSTTSVLSGETQPSVGVDLEKEQSRHSGNTSLDLGANRQNGQCDPLFQKESGLSESASIDASHESCQAAGPSKVVKDTAEIAIGCDEVKKKDRRFRMASIDLGDYKPSCERDERPKRKPRFGGSYSFDASHDPSAAQVKAQPSMMYPSSSLPRFFPVESHYKVSENSSSKSSQKNPYRSTVGAIPPLAEELDVNSAAAVSVAVLQRAIEEAEMRIRLAKAFLERECHGSTNLRFKDTLKVKVSKKRGLANEINNFKQPEMRHCSPTADRDMQPCSPLERKRVVENAKAHPVFEDQVPPVCEAQALPVFEDQKNSVMNGELTESGARKSNLIGGDDKQEGEWEAAKHLNQLISGVKNRLASFMSWQTETETDSEKKEGLKEMEPNIELRQQLEEVEHTFDDREALKQKRLEVNHGIASAGKVMNAENTVQFASEALVAEEHESIRSFSDSVKQNKAVNAVDFIPDTEGSSSENFQFFAYRNQILCDPPDPKIEETGPLEIRECEMENGQEQVIKEVKIEHRAWHDEEQQDSGDKFVAHDTKRQDDVYNMNGLDSSDDENDKTVDEPCSLIEDNEMEISHEEGREGLMSRNSNTCSFNEEKVEMVEEHCSMDAHDEKVPACEDDWQDDTISKDYAGSCDDEFHEIVEEPYTIAEHDGKRLTHDVDGQGDLCEIHLGDINEESNDSVKELCTQAGHERNNVIREKGNDISLNEEFREVSTDYSHWCENILEKTDNDGDCEVLKENKKQHENVEIVEEFNLVRETWKNDSDQGENNHIEEVSRQKYGWEDIKVKQSETDHIEPIEETAEGVTLQSSFIVSAEGEHKQKENEYLSKGEACSFVMDSSKIREAVYADEEIERMMEMSNSSSKLEMDLENPVQAQMGSGLIGEWPPVSAQTARELIVEEPVLTSVSTEINMEHDKNVIQKDLNGNIRTLPHENHVSFGSESDMSLEQKDVIVKVVEPESQDNLENQNDLLHEPGDNLHVGEFDTGSDQDAERSGAEAGHWRRRWFDNSGIIGTAERPSILEGNRTDLEIEQEILDESELSGSVEIHADELDCSVAELKTGKDVDIPSNQDGVKNTVETTPTRRKWFVKRGEQGAPEPLSLFEGIKVNLEVPLNNVNESVMHNTSDECLDMKTKCEESINGVKSDVAINGENSKQNGETAPRRRRWFEGGEKVEAGQQLRINEDVGLTVEMDQESNVKGCVEKHGKLNSMSTSQEKDDVHNKVEPVKEHLSDQDDLNRKEKAREKEKIAVERAIREARERAFAEARERARKDAAERPNVEARHKVAAGIQEKLGKVSSEATSSLDKASVEAKLKAERAAVERATSEARERALQRALSEKAFHRSKEQEPKYQSSRSSDSSNNSEKFDGADVESTQRRKARLERQKRTMERATNALEEKNKRDILAQKEQAAKNILADSLDSEVKRWSTGKEGNLRALLSTLQYILGPDSGWQPVSLTDLVAATAVRKSYKKATLCVHPDKLQQRGASIQQKYICEKVFDLLKEAWSKFNPNER
uniref:J domain-containing protein n=1 Tax=Chenopodium quinoa TaxID=63459 RepID=A0A803MXH0_CHEQI